MNGKAGKLIILIVGHGDKEKIYFDSETLTADLFKEWLNTLQTKLKNNGQQNDIIIILGTCYSGSFISKLSGEGRIIITSAHKDEMAFKGPVLDDGIRQGDFFIAEFLKKIQSNYSIKKSFVDAALLTRHFTYAISDNFVSMYDDRSLQHPMIDDNHDGEGSHDLRFSISGEGQIAIGLAVSFQLIPELAFGITFNFWENWPGKNGWEQTTWEKGPVRITETIVESNEVFIFHKYNFQGFNINLGLLWDITNHFTLGAVVKTPFSADLAHTRRFQSISPTQYQSPSRTQSEKLDMPMSYGIGVAYRFSDQWTISADIYSTKWQDFILTDSNGDRFSFINGKKEELSNVKPTHHFRLGLEYLMFNKNLKYIIPIRGGIFYDPMPADGYPDNYYGLSLGTGFAQGKYIFDIACQYRYGNNVGQDKLERFKFSQDFFEVRGYGSLIYYF